MSCLEQEKIQVVKYLDQVARSHIKNTTIKYLYDRYVQNDILSVLGSLIVCSVSSAEGSN